MSRLVVGTLEGISDNNYVIDLAVGTNLNIPGQIIQMATAKSGPARQTIASTTPQVITGLSIPFAPKSASSLIVIKAQIATSATHVSTFGVYKDGSKTVSTSGYTNNNEAGMQVTTYEGSSTTGWMWSIPLIHYENASTTTQRTYDIRASSGWSGTTYSLYINNRGDNDMASFSHMLIMEIGQ